MGSTLSLTTDNAGQTLLSQDSVRTHGNTWVQAELYVMVAFCWPRNPFWKQRGFLVLLVMSQSIWATCTFSCGLRFTSCPAVQCAERSDRKSQHWPASPVPALLSGQYLRHQSQALCSPCAVLSPTQVLWRCCEFAHTNPNSSSVDTIPTHAEHRFSDSQNRAVIFRYSRNCRMKWKVIRGSCVVMVNGTVGTSVDRKISQQECYYLGLCFRWPIYANHM